MTCKAFFVVLCGIIVKHAIKAVEWLLKCLASHYRRVNERISKCVLDGQIKP